MLYGNYGKIKLFIICNAIHKVNIINYGLPNIQNGKMFILYDEK